MQVQMFERLMTTAAAAVLLSAAGCTGYGPESPGTPISFNGTVETKALLDTDGLQNHTLLVNDIHVAGDGTESVYMHDVELNYHENQWTSSPKYYWTKGGSHYFAAHVAGQGLSFAKGDAGRDSDRLNSAQQMTLSLDNQPDILYAFATRNMETAEDPTATVTLNFNHALSAIVININNVSRDYFRLSSCRLEGTATTARLEISRDAGVAVSDYSGENNPSYGINKIDATIDRGESLTLYKGSADGSGSLLVWPQNLQERKLVLNYFDSEDTQWTSEVKIPLGSSSLSNWLPGRRYTYNVNLADDNIYVTFSIVPWAVNDVIIN